MTIKAIMRVTPRDSDLTFEDLEKALGEYMDADPGNPVTKAMRDPDGINVSFGLSGPCKNFITGLIKMTFIKIEKGELPKISVHALVAFSNERSPAGNLMLREINPFWTPLRAPAKNNIESEDENDA